MSIATTNDEERWDVEGIGYVSPSFLPLKEGKPVRTVMGTSGDVAYVTNLYGDEEQERQARLIAAAPDLLRACKEAVYRIEMDSDALRRKGARELQLLRDAIAKAEPSTR